MKVRVLMPGETFVDVDTEAEAAELAARGVGYCRAGLVGTARERPHASAVKRGEAFIAGNECFVSNGRTWLNTRGQQVPEFH